MLIFKNSTERERGDDWMTIGKKISEIRKAKGVTQIYICRAMEKSPTWLSVLS